MNLWKKWLFYVPVLAVIVLLIGSSFHTASISDKERKVVEYDLLTVRSLPMDQTFSFAGEELDFEPFDIKERLERELLVNAYLHANTLLILKRTKRFFPEIERILKEEKMPDDLKYLAVAESGLINNTSSAGAKGFWQFMEPTAKSFDLEINSEIDERYHLEKSTRAACRYLKSYREKFGSWQLAACAYNMGGPRLEKDMAIQSAASLEELNLNSETSRYLFRIIALKAIIEQPELYGFQLSDEDYYPPFPEYKEITVSGPIENWGAFAKKHGTHYRMLKIYNPWLTSTKLTNKAGKTYKIRLPK